MGAGIEEDEVVVQAPAFGPGLFAAGHGQHAVEQLPAEFVDRRLAAGDASGVDVHQVVPAPRQVVARGDLDDRAFGQAVGRAAAGGEHVQVHAGRQLQRAADEVAGRGGREEQAFLLHLFAGADHAMDRAAAALDDGAHGLLDDVGQAALLVAGRGVGAAVGLAAGEVGVVPAEFAHDRVRHLLRRRAAGELVDCVAHLGVLAEHHRAAGAHQQVGGETHRRVGGDTGEGVAAAALHTHHQLAHRAGLALAAVEAFQMGFRLREDAVNHRHEPDVLLILQTDHIRSLALIADRNGFRGEQALRLQLLAAQAEHHHLAAEVRVAGQVAHGSDRDDRVGRVDGHAAAVAVRQAHHTVHVRVLRQQVLLDAFDREFEHARHALHRGGDGQQVARADAAVGVAVAQEAEAVQR